MTTRPAVRYLVHDVEPAVAFYVERLGFTLIERWGPAMAIVELAGVRLWLAGPTASAARPMPDGRQPEPGGWNRLVIEVEDLAASVADLQAAGVTFRNQPISGPGGSQVLVEDPAGNPVELFQPR
jgi:catechol 2,3-dioxygenase-like lactoylglutathione lyase family enzyme